MDEQPGKTRLHGINDRGIEVVSFTDTGEAHDIFFVFLMDNIDDIINGNDADQPVTFIYNRS